MQIAGVIGLDRCGSTIASRVLESVSGVVAPGELHWLLDAPAQGGMETRIHGWNIDRLCVACREKCPVLPPSFTSRTFSEKGLYRTVGMKIGCQVLVSSDKRPRHYARFVREGTMVGVVLWKRPAASATSAKLGEGMTVANALKVWDAFHARVLKWAPGFCSSVLWVEYGSIIRKPRLFAAAFAGLVGLPAPRKVDLSKPFHSLGGNRKANSSKLLVPDNRWSRSLTRAELKQIEEYSAESLVLRELSKKQAVL